MSVPVELWAFILGSMFYAAVPLIPQAGYVPANPVAFFAAAAAFHLVLHRDRTRLWLAIAMGALTIVYPVLVVPSWIQDTTPTRAAIYWAVLTPFVLLFLLFSPRVRRLAPQQPSTTGAGRDEGATGQHGS